MDSKVNRKWYVILDVTYPSGMVHTQTQWISADSAEDAIKGARLAAQNGARVSASSVDITEVGLK